jgi:hypothetical protein
MSVFGKSKPSQLGSTRGTKLGERSSGEFILRDTGHHTYVNDGRMGTTGSLSDEEAGQQPKDGIQVTTMYEIHRDGSRHG